MFARSIVIAAAALTFASAAVGEPPKPAVADASTPAKGPGGVVLASADQVRTPAPNDQSQAPAKPVRHGRVTTCRCADQVSAER